MSVLWNGVRLKDLGVSEGQNSKISRGYAPNPTEGAYSPHPPSCYSRNFVARLTPDCVGRWQTSSVNNSLHSSGCFLFFFHSHAWWNIILSSQDQCRTTICQNVPVTSRGSGNYWTAPHHYCPKSAPFCCQSVCHNSHSFVCLFQSTMLFWFSRG